MKRNRGTAHRRQRPDVRKPERPPSADQRTPLAAELRRTIPLVIGIGILNFLLASFGILRPMQLGVLDTWLRIRALRPDPKNIVVVAITNDDYQSLFNAISPLDASKLRKLIDAIALGRPKVIGVDIDTSDARFKELQLDPQWPPVVWASVPEQLDKVRFTVQPVLGGAGGPAQSGVALLPQEDNYVRDYVRQVVTDHGILDSFPVTIARLYRGSPEELALSKNTWDSERLLDFWGAPDQAYRFDTYSASTVLRGAQGTRWQSEGVLTDKIVLLAGVYEAGRDRYQTPVGVMSGTEILAEAIETELHGGGARPPSEPLLFILNAVVGVALILVYEEWGFRVGAVANTIAIPAVPPVLSLVCFSTTRYWIVFLLMPIALLIEQAYLHGRQRQKEALLRLYRLIRHKG
jgi:CHASE2 domain-containing sensor protein